MATKLENIREESNTEVSSKERLLGILTGLPMQMVALALATRLLLFSLAWYVAKLIPTQEEMGSPKVLTMWGNWDTWHYVTIGVAGYDRTEEGVNSAFFPVFPMILATVKKLFGDHLEMNDYRWVAVLISTAFLLIGTYALTVLFEQMASPRVAVLGVTLFLISPFSFFLNAGYTDSILVLLIAVTFIAAKKEKWLLAAILVAIATATRVTGIFLIPTILLMAWRTGAGVRILAMITAISPAGLLAYMAWQWINLGSPIRFYTVQSHWGDFHDRTGEYVEAFLDSPLRWTMDTDYAPTLLLNVGVCILWWATLWPMYRRFGLEFTFFNLLIILQSSLFILSQGRYLLAAIGACLALAAVVEERPQWPVLKYGLLASFMLAFTTLALLFANGQWII